MTEAHGQFIDPRQPVHRLRRKQCELIMRKYNLPWQPGMPKDLMAKRIMEAGIDVTQIEVPQTTRFASPAPEEEPAEKPQNGGHEVDATELLEREYRDLNRLGMAELRSMCKEQGIPLKRTDKRPDLVAKLNGTSNG